jgi:hypothetical protein
VIPLFLLNLAGRLRLTGAAQKIVGAVIGILGLIALAGLLWFAVDRLVATHDRRVITQDRAVSNAEVLTRQRGVERQAGADKDARDDQFATNQTEVKEATDAAASNSASPLDVLFSRLR